MKIPALDMKAHLAPIREEIDKAIADVIDKGAFILGAEVKKLEQEICNYSGSKYAIGVSNGTDAISLALEALGIKQGDRVLCPAFTYYATAGAIANTGAIPLFVDIDPKTYCISIESVKDCLSLIPSPQSPAPKAIIPVHLYGQCADMEAILQIAKEHNLKVIEDTAQAFGATCHCDLRHCEPEQSESEKSWSEELKHPDLSASSRPQDDRHCHSDPEHSEGEESQNKIMDLGLLRSYGARNDEYYKAGTMGDCGTISFFPGKNLGACGDAGMVLAQDKAVAERLLCLRNQGSDAANKYKHISLGHNNRLDAIQAAVLLVKLKYIDKWNKQREKNAAYYNSRLKDTGLALPCVPDTNTHTYHQYTLRAKDNTSRDNIISHLQGKGIDTRVFYPIPLHLQPCFAYLGYKKGDFPESEQAANTAFSIPVYPELTAEQMDYIVESVKGLL
jgi:dTDP-4-amino-4,6-dideoxygalactose transaminase